MIFSDVIYHHQREIFPIYWFKVSFLINEDHTKDHVGHDKLSCPNVEDDISEDLTGSTWK